MNKDTLNLIKKAKAKDKKALEHLIDIYAPFIRKVVRYYGILLDKQEREDLYIEGLLALLRAINVYDEKRGSFENILFISVRNSILDILSKKKSPKFSFKYIFEQDFDIEEIVILKEEINEFSKALTELENEVFKLYIAGFKISEIANKLGKSYKSIDNAFQRIKRKAKNFVKQS